MRTCAAMGDPLKRPLINSTDDQKSHILARCVSLDGSVEDRPQRLIAPDLGVEGVDLVVDQRLGDADLHAPAHARGCYWQSVLGRPVSLVSEG